jgi:hypothetical protein
MQMTNQHPINPRLRQVQQWVDLLSSHTDHAVFSLAAQWGADQELKACKDLLDINKCPYEWIDLLQSARRPKPPSLKEQALKAVDEMSGCMNAGLIPKLSCLGAIRRALEALPSD